MTVRRQTGAAHSITIRTSYPNTVGMLGQITTNISAAEGDIGAIDIVSAGRDSMVRDITINARDDSHAEILKEAVSSVEGVTIVNVSDQVFLRHLGGKIEMQSKTPIKTRNDMSLIYTPGVARVSKAIYDQPESVWNLTSKGNTVAIVTDGSAVLGLGDIGPAAALPVMEGKAQLLKELVGVDAWPIVLDTHDTAKIVDTIKLLSHGFGAINLEDISAPRCFEIEHRLHKELSIPVFHDDQHGTAIVVLAALYNAVKVVNKKLPDLKVVLVGVGAAGVATTKLLIKAGVKNIVGVDREGILDRQKDYGNNKVWKEYSEITNPDNISGHIQEAMKGADVFIGLSGPGVLGLEEVSLMNRKPIIFAMANPDPEIWPEEVEGVVEVMATGRSDYPNQVNNALCFPGMFRGILDARAQKVTDGMKMAAAFAISKGVPESHLNNEYIMPSIFDTDMADQVAKGVKAAAMKSGVALKN